MTKNLRYNGNLTQFPVKNHFKNEFQNIDPKSQKKQTKNIPLNKTFLSCLVENFSFDQVEKMIESPTKRTDRKKLASSLLQNLSTRGIKAFQRFEFQRQLLNPPKLSKICTNPKKQSSTELTSQKDKTLQRKSLEQKLKTAHNQNVKINLTEKSDIIQIEKIKRKIQRLRSKAKLAAFDELSQKSLDSRKAKDSKASDQKNFQRVEIKNQYDQIHPKSKLDIQNFKVKNSRNQKLSIDDFQQIQKLGAGIYGSVSLHRHRKSNFLFAIKKIAKKDLISEYSIYLSRQIKLQSFTDHPNIAQIYAFFDDSEYIYLVLEFCNEGNLFSVLQKEGGRMTEEKVKKYIRHVCKGIESLHSESIIHRDLKPENILVSNGVAKICDFGWAIQTSQLSNALCGTPLYSSPQVVKCESYDRKIDIWSLGVMTFQFIYGCSPFDIQSSEDLHKVVEKEIEFPQDGRISDQCKDFIERCMQKNPQERPQIWSLLKHPFLLDEQKIRDSIKVSVVQNKDQHFSNQ